MTDGKALTAVARVTRAREQFMQLSGHEPESVSGFVQVDGGHVPGAHRRGRGRDGIRADPPLPPVRIRSVSVNKGRHWK